MSVYIDSGSEDCSVEEAISKVSAGEALQRSAHEVLQTAAGAGFVRDYPGANQAGLPHSHDIRGNQQGIAAVYSLVGAQNIFANAATFAWAGGY